MSGAASAMSPQILVIAALAAVVLLAAARPLSDALVRFRAARLPHALSDRFLEEWLAELQAIDGRLSKLRFAIALALTRTRSLVEAAGGDEETVLPLASGTVLSVGDVRVSSTVGSRVAALLVDSLLLIGLWRGMMWLMDAAWTAHLIAMVVWTMLVSVLCVVRFGGSPGKLLMKLRIAPVEGGSLTWRHALIRAAPDFVLTLTPLLVMVTVLRVMSSGDAVALSALDQQRLAVAAVPAWFWTIHARLTDLWWLGNLFCFFLLSGDDRRALHDYVAGTIVLMRVPLVVAAPEPVRPAMPPRSLLR